MVYQFKDKVKKNDFRSADMLFSVFFKLFVDLNNNVYKSRFFGSILNHGDVIISKSKLKLEPIFISQMGLLFNTCPLRFKGMLTNDLINYLSVNFRKNTVFLLSNDGFLTHIMVMQTNVKDRVNINSYFAHHLDDLYKYQYFSTEYEPLFDMYKLLTAKPNPDKNAKDIILTFI
jgi:hypothetical protein